MSKSLLESAAEILGASVAGAGKEPMLGGVQAANLGGSSMEQPDGGDIGAAAASMVGVAPRPGQAGAPAEPQKKVGEKPEKVEDEEEEAKDNLQEEDLTEEELEAYLDSLSEEELRDMIAEMGSKPLADKAPYKLPKKPPPSTSHPDMGHKNNIPPKTMKEMVEENMGSCKQDIDALFSGEGLSEEFKTKATTIFEAAVRSRVENIVEKVLENNEEVIAETVADIQEEMTGQIDEYLNYVVEQWMEENQLAIETGIRTEIAEDFMAGLKNLFVEHYIEVPEDKADLVEAMAEEVVEARQALEEQKAQLASITKALNESKSKEILRKICEGLTEVQVQKIKSLAEGVEFTTDGEYTDKLTTIRESYFPTKPFKGAAPQTVVETSDQPAVNNVMDYYVKAITKQLPK